MSSLKIGRPSTFPIHTVRKFLRLYKDSVLIDGNVAGKNNKIWKVLSKAVNSEEISEQFNTSIIKSTSVSAAHIYLAVKGNRYKLQDILFTPPSSEPSSLSTNCESSYMTTSDSTTLESDSSSIISSSDKDNVRGVLNFNIHLSKVEWAQMKPERVQYKDKIHKYKKRSILRLKRKAWTHIINSHFWKETKLPCRLSYHGGRVATSDAIHAVTVSGTCTYCKSKFNAYLNALPVEDENVEFICSYRGYFKNEHPKNIKRNLAGIVLQKALKTLNNENMSPLAFQRKQANDVMNFGDCEPAHLASTSQLRSAKSKAVRNIRVDENPVVAIGKAMHASRYKNIIRDLSYDKFQVRYHSSAQIHVYRQYCKENYPVSLAIDATGGIAKSLKRAPGVRSGPIFLYSAVVRENITKKIFPICTLLSERHDTETLRHWLTNFLRCDVPLPQEVVVDMSSALMSACVQAFTTLPSLEAYINRCAQLLRPTDASTESIQKPECFLRNDVAHLIKLITTWPCFRDAIRLTKQFYVRSMCLVLQSKNLDEIKMLISHIIIVATSKTEGQDEANLDTPCETSKRYLIARIGGLVSSPPPPSENIEEDTIMAGNAKKSMRNMNKFENSPFYRMVYEIKESVIKNTVTGTRGNQQFLPDIVKHILKLCSYLPIWTSIMVPIFGFGGVTASTAAVESDFNILKNVLFKNIKLPLRVDDFIFHHIPAIEGAMKLASANKHKETQVFSDFCDSEHSSAESPRFHRSSIINEERIRIRIKETKEKEDWGGLSSTHSRTHSSYLLKSPEFAFFDLTKNRPTISIGILKNGNISDLHPVNIMGEMMVLSNTCAFDSIVQLFAVAYCDSELFKPFFNNTTNKFLKLASYIVSTGINRKAYSIRTEILAPLYKNVRNLPQGLKQINCETGVSTVASLILKTDPGITEISLCSAETCPLKKREVLRATISVPLKSQEELYYIQEIIKGELLTKTTRCFQMNNTGAYCEGERTMYKTVNDYLLIEPIQLNNEQRFLQCILKVRDIPPVITLNEKVYHLRGCIGFLGTDDTEATGHYVAYSLRSDGMWETYNDLKQRKDSYVTKNEIRCHLMLYTV